MSIKEFQPLTKYIIVSRQDDSPLFGDRLFDRIVDAKNAFRQRFKNYTYKDDACFDKKFNEQEEYEILELTFTIEDVKSLGRG